MHRNEQMVRVSQVVLGERVKADGTGGASKTTPTKAELSPAQRQLLAMMQELNFGRIEGLAVQNGQPSFLVPPRITKIYRMTGENGARAEHELRNFALKKEYVALFDLLQQYSETTIACIEVQHGLPFLVEHAQ